MKSVTCPTVQFGRIGGLDIWNLSGLGSKESVGDSGPVQFVAALWAPRSGGT